MTFKIYEVTGNLVIDMRAREWCTMPYPNHPKGCPNYGNKEDCPPKAPLIQDFIDLNKDHWFIVVEFDIGTHAKAMKQRHPQWTERQCRNVLYWQGSVRKQLREGCINFCNSYYGFNSIFTLLPEAMGVHVIRTAKKLGIPIKARPKDTVYKIALVGYPRNLKNSPLDDFLKRDD